LRGEDFKKQQDYKIRGVFFKLMNGKVVKNNSNITHSAQPSECWNFDQNRCKINQN